MVQKTIVVTKNSEGDFSSAEMLLCISMTHYCPVAMGYQPKFTHEKGRANAHTRTQTELY